MELIDWKFALDRSVYDEKVGIKIAKLNGNPEFSTFISAIDPDRYVNPHYHKHGQEYYHIIDGNGEIVLVDLKTKVASKPQGIDPRFLNVQLPRKSSGRRSLCRAPVICVLNRCRKKFKSV